MSYHHREEANEEATMKSAHHIFLSGLAAALSLLFSACGSAGPAAGSSRAAPSQTESTIHSEVVSTPEPASSQSETLSKPDDAIDNLLRQALEIYDSGDDDGFYSAISSAEYLALAGRLAGASDNFYHGETGAEGMRHGRGIAVYGSGFYYIGQWEGGFRQGDAAWIKDDGESRNVCQYTFVDDIPNGKYTEDATHTYEGTTFYNHVEGSFVDGLRDGEAYITNSSSENKNPTSYLMRYSAGKALPYDDPPQYMTHDGVEHLIIARSTNDPSYYMTLPPDSFDTLFYAEGIGEQ